MTWTLVLMGAAALVLACSGVWRWLSWRKLPKPAELRESMILVSPYGRRVKIVSPQLSPVDHRVMHWNARDDYSHLVEIPTDGFGWRLPE